MCSPSNGQWQDLSSRKTLDSSFAWDAHVSSWINILTGKDKALLSASIGMLLKKERKNKNRPLNLIYKHSPRIHLNFQAIYNFANVLSVSSALILVLFGLTSVSLCSSCSFNDLLLLPFFPVSVQYSAYFDQLPADNYVLCKSGCL